MAHSALRRSSVGGLEPPNSPLMPLRRAPHHPDLRVRCACAVSKVLNGASAAQAVSRFVAYQWESARKGLGFAAKGGGHSCPVAVHSVDATSVSIDAADGTGMCLAPDLGIERMKGSFLALTHVVNQSQPE